MTLTKLAAVLAITGIAANLYVKKMRQQSTSSDAGGAGDSQSDASQGTAAARPRRRAGSVEGDTMSSRMATSSSNSPSSDSLNAGERLQAAGAGSAGTLSGSSAAGSGVGADGTPEDTLGSNSQKGPYATSTGLSDYLRGG